MKLTFHLNNEAEDNLLDIGQDFTFVKDDEDGHIVTVFDVEDDDEVLLESLSNEDLCEFLGIDSEYFIYMEVGE